MAETNEHGEPEMGQRETSPPGRETREDWKGSQRPTENTLNNGTNDNDSKTARSRSRSRSPANRARRSSPGRGRRYSRDGTNTTSDEPHLQRARLFVGNIEPNRTHRRDLVRLFSSHGEVLGVSVHKGYAFVQMDRERSANKAVNYEDNRMFMGSRIHVEFSQVALKNGAKFIRIPIEESPPRDVRPPPVASDSLALLEIEREREERLSRILQMERELSRLREREDTRRGQTDYSSYDRYDGYRSRGSPPGPPSRDSSYMPRKEPTYESSRPDDRGRGGYYSRPGPESMPRGPSGGGGGSYRDNVSYPMQGGGPSQYDRRDKPSSQYAGSGGGYNRSGQMSSASVGYSGGGNPGGKTAGPGGVPPPGWPSTDYDKSNANRAPFANAAPWD